MKISERLLEYAFLLVLFPFFCFVLGSLGFLVGLPLTKWYAAVAFALTLCVLKLRKKSWRDWRSAVLIFLGLQLIFMVVGALHVDNSWDARLYHKPAVILMADGWNPVWEPDVMKFYERNGIAPKSLRTSHLQFFPKGQWIVCSILYLATGNVDAGDYVNYVFLLALAAVGYCALREWLGIGRKLAILATACMVLNPISSMCLINGHIDGLLGASLLIFLLGSVCYLKNGSRRWIPWIFISALYGCSLKHTGPVYFGLAGVMLTIPLLWQVIRTKIRRPMETSLTTVGLKDWLKLMIPIPFAVLILCANPFVTNTVTHTSPFYPLHTFDRVNHPVENILGVWYSLEGFKESGYIRRFVYSYFTGEPRESYQKASFESFEKVGSIDWRNGFISLNAFGWIFGLALLFSLFLFCFLPFRNFDVWVLLILAATVLIQPHSWWARFVPQFWAFPVLVFLVTLTNWRGIHPFESRLKWITCLFLVALCAQGLLTFTYINARMLSFIQLDQRQAELLETHPQSVLAVCLFEKDHPGEMEFYPSFNYYLIRQIRDQRLSDVTVFQSHHGWQHLPGKPLTYYDGVLLCCTKEPVGTYDYDEVELDKKDVSLSKIPSSVLWRLTQRFHQLLEH